jgi:hypothetical protein
MRDSFKNAMARGVNRYLLTVDRVIICMMQSMSTVLGFSYKLILAPVKIMETFGLATAVGSAHPTARQFVDGSAMACDAGGRRVGIAHQWE